MLLLEEIVSFILISFFTLRVKLLPSIRSIGFASLCFTGLYFVSCSFPSLDFATYVYASLNFASLYFASLNFASLYFAGLYFEGFVTGKRLISYRPCRCASAVQRGPSSSPTPC